MSKTLPTILVAAIAAILLCSPIFGESPHASTLTGVSALGVAEADVGLVQRTAVVCAANGCVRVQTSRVHHYRPLHR